MEARIVAIAAANLGLITRTQLLELDLSSNAITYRITTGRLRVVHPGVYAIGGCPPSWEQELHAALLAGGEGAFVSHLAAARCAELEDVMCARPHILVAHERRLDLVRVDVHRTRRLDPSEITRRGGIRLTTPARTLLDIAGIVSLRTLERALDDARRRKIVTLEQIRASLELRGPKGVKGWGRLSRLVDQRVGSKPTGSGKETVFLSGLRKRRLPVPVPQFEIFDHEGRFVARPDFAYPKLRLAIEIDSGFHANPARRLEDLRRQNRMTRAKWGCLYFDTKDRTSQLQAYDEIEMALAAFRGA